MERKQATLFGATGLIGGYLLDIILEDPYFNHVIVVSRRPFSKKHPKMDTRIIDFSTTKQIEQSIANSDFVFSAIGTTQAQVKGDKSAYRKIDFDITLSIAMACKKMNIKSFLFVSSSGANSSSASFYMKLKGKIDEVNIETVKRIAKKIVSRPITISSIGPIENLETLDKIQARLN